MIPSFRHCLALALTGAGGFIAMSGFLVACLDLNTWPGPRMAWAGVIMLPLAYALLRDRTEREETPNDTP